MNPEKQYYTQLRRFEQGDRSPDFLYHLVQMASDAMDKRNGRRILNEWLKTQPDLYTKDHVNLILSFTESTKDKGFEMMVQEPRKVDAVIGQNQSRYRVIEFISNEQLKKIDYSTPPDSLAPHPDWAALEVAIAKKYPAYAKETIAYYQIGFYRFNKQYDRFGRALYDYMQVYGDSQREMIPALFAWETYKYCPNDPRMTAAALEWCKTDSCLDKYYWCKDTYARLLLRSGKKDEAIEWEIKAIDQAREKKAPDLPDYEKELEEMKVSKP